MNVFTAIILRTGDSEFIQSEEVAHSFAIQSCLSLR